MQKAGMLLYGKFWRWSLTNMTMTSGRAAASRAWISRKPAYRRSRCSGLATSGLPVTKGAWEVSAAATISAIQALRLPRLHHPGAPLSIRGAGCYGMGAMGTCLITNVRIIDGTWRAPFAGEVLVEGSRITAVTAGATGPHPDGARTVDGRGATLMPGLIEPHAHLSFADGLSTDLTQLPVEEHMLITVRNART